METKKLLYAVSVEYGKFKLLLALNWSANIFQVVH